ncbi:MAG: four helix bundle protein [Verrucomicrobiota bacterium]
MSTITRFEDIQAWQKAREVASAIYKLCKAGDLATDFGLRDQIRRSAVSSQSNIAEGFGRESNQEFIRFLKIAKGSSCEFRSQLYNLLDAEYIDQPIFDRLYQMSEETERLIGGFINYLEKNKRTNPKGKMTRN